MSGKMNAEDVFSTNVCVVNVAAVKGLNVKGRTERNEDAKNATG